MKLKLIKNDNEYQSVLKRADKLFHAHPNSKEQDELEILILLIEKYENEMVGEFPDPDPIEAIKFRMDQLELSQQDLAGIIGLKSRASEILSRKRPLSINIIRKLSKRLTIPAEVLIQPYELN